MYNKEGLKSTWAGLLGPIFRIFLQLRLRPAHITLCGSLLILAGCYFVIQENHVAAFTLLFMGGLCDAIDGAYARTTGQVTRWGGFLDSVIDRYNEFTLAGSVLYTCREEMLLYYFCFLYFLGISLMSYTRALYEKNNVLCPNNPFEYLERGLLFLVFLVWGRIDLWLICVALGTHIFVGLRVYGFYRYCQLLAKNEQ